MKMTLAVLLLCSCCCLLIACSMVASLVPVEGPLSLLRPVPIYKIKAGGTMSGGGKLSVIMDKETCEGRWATASDGPAVTFAAGNLISQYGSAYLSGYSVSQGGGKSPGQGAMTCADGRVIQAEFLSSGSTGHGFGIAKDNQGNVYKLIF